MTTSPLVMARAAAAAVELVKVYGSGDTAVYALGGVTVEFAAARFTAIMGPSGSGKSTLMHCLAGLDTPTSGSVRIGTAELSGLSDRTLTLLRRSHVGFVFQSFNLLPALTAEQNIRLPLDLAGRPPATPTGWCSSPTGGSAASCTRRRRSPCSITSSWAGSEPENEHCHAADHADQPALPDRAAGTVLPRDRSRCRLRLRHPGDGRLDESGVLRQLRGRGQERRRRRDPACARFT